MRKLFIQIILLILVILLQNSSIESTTVVIWTYGNTSNLTYPILEEETFRTVIVSYSHVKYLSSRTFSKIYDLRYILLDNNELNDTFYNLKFTYSTYASIELTLSYNLITVLKTFGKSMSRLTLLNLKGNQIEKINNSVFVNLYQLKKLDLSNNRLTYIYPNAFLNLTSLATLILTSNRIKLIQSRAFSQLPQLTELQLASNQLHAFESYVFGKFENNLRTLDLSMNDLSDFNATGLANVSNFQLRGNNLQSFDLEFFKPLFGLSDLDLSFNDLNIIYSIDYIRSDFQYLTYLDFSNMFLKYVDLDFFMIKFQNLQTFKLDFNQIQNITRRSSDYQANLVLLSLKFNLIGQLDANVFANMTLLKTLDLSYNLLTSLLGGVFTGLRSLRNLTVQSNYIAEIAPDAFDDLVNLKQLNLTSNKLKSFRSGTFASLKQLEELYLSENKLDSVLNFYFKPLVNLRVLQLDRNFILSVEPNSFLNLNSLTSLNLSRNFLSRIEDKTFANMSLTELDLSGNEIEQVSENSFSHSTIVNLTMNWNRLDSIEFLNHIAESVFRLEMANNQFKQLYLKAHTIKLVYPLQKLNLQRCEIGEFRFESSGYVSLGSLDLSYNQLTSLTVDAFRNLRNLSRLDVSNNPLKFIEHGFFIRSFDSLKYVYLNNSLGDMFADRPLESFSPDLVELDLSNNNMRRFRLENWTNMTSLSLYNSRIDLNTSDFNAVSWLSLKSLDIGCNNFTFDLSLLIGFIKLNNLYLKWFNLESLDSVFTLELLAVRTLDLSYNRLKEIRQIQFEFMINIYTLDLSHNQIEFIEANAFSKMYFLIRLNLEFNRIKKFYFQTLTNKLDTVKLSMNQLEEFHKLDGSDDYATLVSADFSHNRLVTTTDLKSFVKGDRTRLTVLLLNNNLIERLGDVDLAEMSALEQLDLKSNKLGFIDRNAFVNLRRLKRLDLSDNYLTFDESDDVFRIQYHLSYLNLSYNQVEYVRRDLFTSLFNLNELDLSHNRLLTMENHSFENLRMLYYLNVAQNYHLNFEELSLKYLLSIKDLWMSFDQLNGSLRNQMNLINSLSLARVRVVNDVVYYRSIYVNYEEDLVNCRLTLEFIKYNLQLKLKTDPDFMLFLNYCNFLYLE